MEASIQPLLPPHKASHRKALCLLLSLAAVFLCSATIVTFNFNKFGFFNPPLQNICVHAHDEPSCLAIVSEIASSTTAKLNHVHVLQHLLKKSTSHIQNIIQEANRFSHRNNDPVKQAALVDCVKLMELSIDRIEDSIVALENVTPISHANAHTWLSSVLSNHVTCMDGLNLGPARDRKLLQASPGEINANVIVAKDGSGNYKTVKEAVASAPDNGKSRYVIYVKKGKYKENVEIGKTKKNVMLVGDGMDSTIITGSLNVVDGSTTFKSATVAADGDGFIAQDIRFVNTAGPQKHQAVALRVNADQSVINRCRIDAYQDTLYTHSNRQFYRDCFISGTVDFIFGNAGVVFQKCKIVARKPMSGQKNMVTAQGRTDPNQNTGTSIQKCDIKASSDLEPVKDSVQSYLGRPWKKYSRTVVMQSKIGDHIDPSGWSPWDGDFALKTLYYGEYMNKGPGAGTSERVKWPGYHVITSAAEAKKFTVAELIQGGKWLKSTGVDFIEGL
ncbi:hypothetical protein GH714_000939 [Hevea brasiliensis]|uniref:Pectinesterase n=1 Tax=Hevea brasiliensis TaxID=3981 RepID=A0A6A6LU93_HEVBR|nr:hypothetical protein GH714_000939 [Hevea brasiliensis]